MIWLLLLLLADSLISILCGIALVFLWAVPKIERRFIFQPTRDIYRIPTDFGMPFEQRFVETEDGCRLSAWHICPQRPQASVLYFHGNSGNLGLFNEVFQLLYRAGLEIFAIDYRGYGASNGSPSEEGLYRDASAAVDYFNRELRRKGIPVIYWGRSLGGCVAAHAASQNNPDGLILETSFPSKKSMLRYFPQFRLFRIFTRCRLDTVRHLRRHDFPVLVIHGDQDRTIPIEQGELLFEKLPGPKAFFHVAGADHINIHRLDSSAYMSRVMGFAREIRPPVIH